MPPMTMLGWFHTIMGVIAILTAAYALYRHRIIRASDKLGRAYLLITLVVAGSALAIYNQGGFGVGHILAVLTLTALLAGYLLETLAPFGKWSVYLQTGAYTATVLFHMIPAITDFLRRLPVGDLRRFAGCATCAELSLGVSRRLCCGRSDAVDVADPRSRLRRCFLC